MVTKVPRFAFEKFPAADSRLTTQMKSVGEVMAIGRTFQESFQKALRGLEVGVDGLNQKTTDREKLQVELGEPGPERIWYVGDAFAQGFTLDEVHSLTHIDPWFLAQIKEIVDIELALEQKTLADLDYDTVWQLKRRGFFGSPPGIPIWTLPRLKFVNCVTSLACVPSINVSIPAPLNSPPVPRTCTQLMKTSARPRQPIARRSSFWAVVPNRIGQGIEFDYCCVHASLSLREDGYETIMVNCNPETVSTDYDTSDRLYFEPRNA